MEDAMNSLTEKLGDLAGALYCWPFTIAERVPRGWWRALTILAMAPILLINALLLSPILLVLLLGAAVIDFGWGDSR